MHSQIRNLPESVQFENVQMLVDMNGDVQGNVCKGQPVLYKDSQRLGQGLFTNSQGTRDETNVNTPWKFGMLLEVSERGMIFFDEFTPNPSYSYRLATVLTDEGELCKVIVRPPGVSDIPSVLLLK